MDEKKPWRFWRRTYRYSVKNFRIRLSLWPRPKYILQGIGFDTVLIRVNLWLAALATESQPIVRVLTDDIVLEQLEQGNHSTIVNVT